MIENNNPQTFEGLLIQYTTDMKKTQIIGIENQKLSITRSRSQIRPTIMCKKIVTVKAPKMAAMTLLVRAKFDRNRYFLLAGIFSQF